MSEAYVGEIRLFGFSRIPVGWLPCDGSLLAISQHDALYALIGTTYGGDGQSSFAVPDMRGQVPVHQGTGPGLSPRVPGESGGSEVVTLLGSQMAGHTHPIHATTAAANANVPSAAVELGALSGDTMYLTDLAGADAVALSRAAVSQAGGNHAHDNLMPTQTVSFCIASVGIFPSRN